MFANVYRVMRDVGMPDPRRVDELEMWEIAVLIGADKIDETAPDPHAHLRADLEYRKQRAAYEAGEGPEPDRNLKFEWTDVPEEEQALMSVLASGSSLS